MNGNIFFTSEAFTKERLSWLREVMKYYTVKIYPESLHYRPRTRTPPFTFFLLGDACYSLIDRQHHPFLETLFALPSLRFVFDPRALNLRGISLKPLKMRFPEQIIVSPPPVAKSVYPFWDCYLNAACKSSGSPSIGFLFMQSIQPYQSSSYVLDLFRSAVGQGIAPEFYGYLDGVHAMHRDQGAFDHENIADSLTEIYWNAAKKGLKVLNLICSQSAISRGYRALEGNRGKIISNCIIPPCRIASLDKIASRFLPGHHILSHTSFAIEIIPQRKIPGITSTQSKIPPPIVILTTHSPYGTEYTLGAMMLATACAHKGIATRMVFIEDGVYCLTGKHVQEGPYPPYDLQEVVRKTMHLENLEYYAYSHSLKNRGLIVNPALKKVCQVNSSELAQIILKPPANIEAAHQRVLVF